MAIKYFNDFLYPNISISKVQVKDLRLDRQNPTTFSFKILNPFHSIFSHSEKIVNTTSQLP